MFYNCVDQNASFISLSQNPRTDNHHVKALYTTSKTTSKIVFPNLTDYSFFLNLKIYAYY